MINTKKIRDENIWRSLNYNNSDDEGRFCRNSNKQGCNLIIMNVLCSRMKTLFF